MRVELREGLVPTCEQPLGHGKGGQEFYCDTVHTGNLVHIHAPTVRVAFLLEMRMFVPCLSSDEPHGLHGVSNTC